MQWENAGAGFAHPLPLTCQDLRNLVLNFAKDRQCNYFWSLLHPQSATTHKLALILLNTQIFLE